MEKVKLTQEQVDALKSALRTQNGVGSDVSNIISWKVTDLFSGDEEALNQVSLETLIVALYVGYELEQSPEEKIKEFYREHIDCDNTYRMAVREGVRATLDFLGIKISGVNC